LAACLLATVLAPYLLPGTDLTAPGTDLAACLLASDLATHLVPGTDLAAPTWSHRSGCRTDLAAFF
jgi:hypothetical protein